MDNINNAQLGCKITISLRQISLLITLQVFILVWFYKIAYLALVIHVINK